MVFDVDGYKSNAFLSLMQLMSRMHGEIVRLLNTAN